MRISLSKKKVSVLKRNYDYRLYNIHYQRNGRHDEVRDLYLTKHAHRSVSVDKLYTFFLFNRHLLRFLYFDASNKSFNKIHLQSFKKSRHRLYSQTFFLTLSQHLTSIVFATNLLNKIEQIKQLTLHRKLFVNGLLSFNYRTLIKPLDFVHVKPQVVKYCGSFNKGVDEEVLSMFDYGVRSVLFKGIKDYKLYSKAVMVRPYVNRLKNRKLLTYRFDLLSKRSVDFFVMESEFYRLVNRVTINLFMKFYNFSCHNCGSDKACYDLFFWCLNIFLCTRMSVVIQPQSGLSVYQYNSIKNSNPLLVTDSILLFFYFLIIFRYI